MEDFFKCMDELAQKEMDNAEKVLKAVNTKNSIEDKAKEYALKEIAPKCKDIAYYSPIIANGIMKQSEVAFKAGAEWMLEKAINWLNDKVMFDEVGRPVKIEQFKKAMEE